MGHSVTLSAVPHIRHALRVSLALLALSVAALSAQPGAAVEPQTRVVDAYIGVRYLEHRETVPRPLRLHVAEIDLRAPGIRLKVSPSAGRRETVRETTLDFVRREGAQLGVNAHFFLPFPSDDAEAWVIGLAASEGTVYSAFETPEQSFALVPDAPAIDIDRRSRARIVHRAAGDGTGRRVREGGGVFNVVSGSAQIVTDGAVTIPTYRNAARPRGELVAGPDGRFDEGHSWYAAANARTAVGLSRDRRRLILVVVERSPISEGLPLDDVGRRLIRDYGVWNALNLDGGGSSTMAWRDPASGEYGLLNTSSDNPGGRRVATSLAVFARPRPARP